MNTITKAFVQADEPVIPAEHPNATRPTIFGTHLAPPEDVPQTLQPLTAPRLLKRAQDVMEQRAAEYDKPEGERSVAAAVVALNAILGRSALTEAEGWLFMELLKNVRLFSAPGYHADSGLDGIAYSALKAEAKAREARQ